MDVIDSRAAFNHVAASAHEDVVIALAAADRSRAPSSELGVVGSNGFEIGIDLGTTSPASRLADVERTKVSHRPPTQQVQQATPFAIGQSPLDARDDGASHVRVTAQLGDAILRPSQSGLRLTQLRRLKRLNQENASHGGTFR